MYPAEIAFQVRMAELQKNEVALRNEQWRLNQEWDEIKKVGSWGRSIQLGAYRGMQEYHRSCKEGECRHPHPNVQKKLDRLDEVGGELTALKTQREGEITAENARKIQLIEAGYKQHREKLRAEIKKAKRKVHPAGMTIRPPSRRHPSGTQRRYAPKRKSAPRPRRR